ncbi:hypothetical protein FACS18945_4720 [Bacteroidia bacterium]|nr:hypothetical protein FACS18945_4720 [Bacteroidia bacterium]
MDKTVKILLGIAGLLGAGFVAFKLLSVKNFAKLLTISPKLDGGLQAFQVTLTEIKIPLAIDFGNRTDETMTISVNAIDVYYKDSKVASTKPNTNEVTIKANSTSTLKGLKLMLSTLSLISIAKDLVNLIISKGDYAALLKDIALDVTCTYNKTIVFSIDKIKLGESKDVNAETGKTDTAAVKGLGLTAASLRNIKPFSDYEMYIPVKSNLKYRDLIMIPDGSVEDTVKLMKDIAQKYAGDTVTLAKYLQKDSVPATLQSIFDFVFNYIQYVPDSRFTEQVRRPLRTLWDRKGDCDCYSVLIGSILTNLQIPFKFRIAEYSNKGYFQHVYVVVPYNGKMLVCDPVVDKCFYEKPTTKHKDF